MPVTDHQVATLRALLAGDLDEHDRLRAGLDRDADRSGYSALIAATFFEAADQRFAAGHDRAAITEFVATARASSPSVADKLDPLLAERMIRGVFEDETLGEVSGQVVVETQLLLLGALLGEMRPGPAGLDALLAEGRKIADEWTS